jgi:hypothetical protein
VSGAPRAAVRFVLRRQARNGGWGWYAAASLTPNDTAAAIQALRAAGVRGAPIRRGLAYLLRLRNRDGGFELTPGRGSDAQSTAWAIQAFVAARKPVPRGALPTAGPAAARRQLPLLEALRDDAGLGGPAQVLPALARRPFPLSVPSGTRGAR